MAYEVDAPKYVRLAQTVQRRIEAGKYPPGTRVPSENQLVQEFGMSRPTVVRALELLKRDGWLESRQGYGTIVRGRPTAIEGRGRRGQETLARNESQAAGRLVAVDRVRAPARVALALELPEQTDVLLRRFLVEEGGEAAELVSSYFPTRLADGTDLVNAEPMHRGLREYLEARLKVRLDHVIERISTRLPDTSEAELLGLSVTTPALNVLVIAQDASGQALQVSDLLFPAHRQELEQTYQLD
ncbi:GntR family transcriptional regulator [Streptomyces pseudovenezuelae]|uniref:GntR family transcriptional regulator n=1 Tax=Streptomyces pseudovenezuelae TaxID=67350 RepID=A0ABT6LFF2_9ACTN|nr:GntR family transcriptional regulator [Streptomyces pseudovenezuelae]MDH6214079.1 GntR family transcriptional regulator [Streptomyces pseudovenezuelae]